MKKKILITSLTIILLLIFSGVVYSYNTPEHKLERQLKLGNKYLLEQKYEEAIIAFTKAISIEPKTINGRLGLAKAFIHTKKLDNAERVLKEVLEIEATNLDAREYLVNIYIAQTKVEEAEKLLKQILTIDPSKNESVLTDAISLLKEVKVSEENYNTALKLMEDKKYIEAIPFFNKVIPKDIDRYSDAQNKANECKSIYINDNLQKAKDEAKNKNFKDAISYLDLILKLEPTNSEAQKLKADYNESIKKQQLSYKRYTNARYGFSIDYPSTFIVKVLPDNNDGIIFSTPDDITELTVSGINNVLYETPSSIYNDLLKEHSDALYKKQEDNWFVVSWIEGDKIVYQKSVVGIESINTFIIKYPSSEKDYYTPIISRLNSTFKTPGIDSYH